jgi:carbamoyltransferase
LVDPGNHASVKRLSQGVKGRAGFRPYALSLDSTAASRVFNWEKADIPLPAMRMQTVATVSDEATTSLRGGLHIDGSTRPQICTEEDNPRFSRLLKNFGNARGISALLNTSFNSAGYPIVASPLDALLGYLRSDIDVLALGNSIIRKIS